MIRIKNLSYSYGKTLVLDKIDITFTRPGIYGILGPNGAGKSTLLKIIGRILNIPAGQVFIEEKDIHSIKHKELATIIAYVPQQFIPNYAFTVRQLLEMGRHPYHGQFDSITKEENELIDYSIKVTELSKLEHNYITELSGGELQRVMIARALVQDTPIIILDEPISHLDIHYQKEIIKLLRNIAIDRNKLIITVLHDMNVGLNYCDYIHLIHDHKVTSGKPKDVLTLEKVKAIYNVDLIKIKHGDSEFIHW